jgi:hypothetical protein
MFKKVTQCRLQGNLFLLDASRTDFSSAVCRMAFASHPRDRLAHLEAEDFRRGVRTMTNEVSLAEPIKGVLMIFLESGTWARYFMAWGGPSVLEPTYGNREDVEKWLRDDYEISPDGLADFHERMKANPKQIGFYFDSLL